MVQVRDVGNVDLRDGCGYGCAEVNTCGKQSGAEHLTCLWSTHGQDGGAGKGESSHKELTNCKNLREKMINCCEIR